MSIFAIMNYVAWALCTLIVFLLAKDIWGVEKQRKLDAKEQSDREKQDL